MRQIADAQFTAAHKQLMTTQPLVNQQTNEQMQLQANLPRPPLQGMQGEAVSGAITPASAVPPRLAVATNVVQPSVVSQTSPTSQTFAPYGIDNFAPSSLSYNSNSDLAVTGATQALNGTPSTQRATTQFSIDPSNGVVQDNVDVNPRQTWTNAATHAALMTAATGVASMALSAPSEIASPPSTTTITARASRSRAASGSHVSASGSRSRAASGSGYQSLLEGGRSRAASSASSVYGMHERDEDDREEDEIDDDDTVHNLIAATASVVPGVEPELKAMMDPIFMDFLADLCSNCE